MNSRLHLLATTTRRFLPLAMIVAMVATVVPTAWTGSLPQPAWQIVMITSALTAAAVSRFGNGNPVAYSVIMVAAVAHTAFTDLGRSYTISPPMPWIDIVGDLIVALALAWLMAYSTYKWLGTPTTRDVVEAVVVLLGASIGTWVVLTQRLLELEMGVGRALAISAFIPISVLVAAFVINLLNRGLRTHRALQLASVASVLFVAGAIAGRLQLVGTWTAAGTTLPTALYSLAAICMLAAMAHENFQSHLTPDPSEHTADQGARLALMGTSVLVAMTSMAIIPPTNRVDTIVRSIGTVALIALVVIRLAIALHQHEQARESLRQRIYLDELTALPTRTRLVEHVQETLDSNWRSEQQPTVVHLNIDRFKNINDTFGHHGANVVLVEIASRLRRLAAQRGGQAARLGGDDFAVIDATTVSTDDALTFAESIRQALIEPIAVADTTVFVTASLGLAVTPRKRTLTAEELIRRADIANHRAKLDGGNRIAVFDDSMQASVARRMDIEHALHGAIGRQEMRLYHQPIVDITTGRVSGFESLMRWQRPDGTIVSPASFIPVAEDTGVICELGAWALHDALSKLRGWIDDGVVDPSTTMSVNVSPRQIADPNFANKVAEALEATKVSPHLLWLEMTESMMLEEPDLAGTTLQEIREMGVRLALDDFGTGFSSLSLLQQFPIQRIKIDRAFVQGIADNTNDRSLVRTIIAMAHSMGLDLVAEGVETVHQLQGLRDLGCNKAQGFLISHPVPAAAMRSTMSALDELTSLPLFQLDETPDAALSPDDEPTVAAGSSFGIGSRRPLGQPVL